MGSSVVYVDADNGIQIIPNRGIYEKVKMKFQETFHYIPIGENERDGKTLHARETLANLARSKKNFQNVVFIYDGIGNLLPPNTNAMEDSSVQALYDDYLKIIRKKGATQIMILHEPKYNDTYKGSTRWQDNADECFKVENLSEISNFQNGKMLLTLNPSKKRYGTKSVAISLDLNTYDIEMLNFDIFGLNEKERLTLDYILEVLSENQELSQSDLIKKVKAKSCNSSDVLGVNSMIKLLKRQSGISVKRTETREKNNTIKYSLL